MEHVAEWFRHVFLIEKIEGSNLILPKMEEYFEKSHIRSVRFLPNLSHWRIETEPRTVGRLGCLEPKCRLGSAEIVENVSPTLHTTKA